MSDPDFGLPLAALIMKPPTQRTGEFGRQATISTEQVRRWSGKVEEHLAWYEQELRLQLAVAVARAASDGRSYVVAYAPLEKRQEQVMVGDGAAGAWPSNYLPPDTVIEQRVLVTLARLADAEVGEFCWPDASRQVLDLHKFEPAGFKIGFQFVVFFREDGAILYPPPRLDDPARVFRRVPAGWERTR